MPLEFSLLIVERDRHVRESICRQFIELGYSVTAVHHPRQALEAATFNSFDVAILAYELPELDGIELMHRLKLTVANLQVILVANQCTPVFAAEALNGGAHTCLQKPCRPHDLESVVEQAIEEHRQSSKPSRGIGDSDRSTSAVLINR